VSITTTDHDIEPFAIEGNGMVSARCLIHGTDTREQWSTLSQAARGFFCDGGLDLRFVTEFHGEDVDDVDVVPFMHDLSGLARKIHGDAEARAYGLCYGETLAWQWHPRGRVEPLVITLAGSTPFGEDDYGTQIWRVTGAADGRVIVEVRVRIDGRV
jgi:hypothetical protein